MTGADTLRAAAADGVNVALREGRLVAFGGDAAVARWAPKLRDAKEQLIILLRWQTDEEVIRRWLRTIGETDHHLIDTTIQWCKTDSDSRRFFMRLAAPTDE